MNNLTPFKAPTYYSPKANLPANNALSGMVSTPSGVKFYTPKYNNLPSPGNALNKNNLTSKKVDPNRSPNALMALYNRDLGQSPGDTPGTGGDPNQGAGDFDPAQMSMAENMEAQGQLDAFSESISTGKSLGINFGLPSLIGQLFSMGASKSLQNSRNEALAALGVNFGESGVGPGTGIGAADVAAAAENASMGLSAGEAAAASLGLGIQGGNQGTAAGPAAVGKGTDGTFSFDPDMTPEQVAENNKEMQNNIYGTLEGGNVAGGTGAPGQSQGTASNFSGTGHQQDNSTGGDGDGTSKIICNELYNQGLMPRHIWEADERFGETLDKAAIDGYHAWARPWVRVMQRSPLATRLTWLVARPWAQHMAFRMKAVEEDNPTGRAMMKIGLPLCRAISKVNLTWRRLSMSFYRRLPWTAF